MNVPSNQPVSFTVYMQAIYSGVKAPAEFIRSKLPRIERAFEMGEPIAMICDELQMVYGLQRPARTKSPRQLAARVVTVPSW